MEKAIQYLKQNDSILKAIITKVPSFRIESTSNVFHDLMSCVLEQQIHYRSTKKIFQKMLDKANLTFVTPENFPVFEEKGFEGVKLSMKKYETVLNVLNFWKEHDIQWEKLSDEQVKTELSKIKGIGPWTVDMILIYTLNRPNIFNYDDFHIKQIMTKLYDVNPKSKLKAQMKTISNQWEPYKSTAFLYLLEWKKLNAANRKI